MAGMTDRILPVVLLPGLDGSGLLFEPLIAHSDGDRNLVVVSYPAEGDQSISRFVEIVEKRISGLDSFHLVVESFSTLVGLRLVSNLPEKVCSLTIAGGFYGPPVNLPVARFPDSLLQILFGIILPRRLTSLLLLNSESHPDVEELLSLALSKLGGRAIEKRVRALFEDWCVDFRGGMQIPSLLLLPKNDRLVSKHSQRRLREQIGTGSVREIDGPHLILQARPDLCWSLITDFIQGVERDRR